MKAIRKKKSRSEIMQAIRHKDTKPEMAVRRLTHSMGYRYRLHRRTLPGTPDLVFPSRRKVVFVHGCFWHQHDCKHGAHLPKSNREYWLPKLARNRERDAEHQMRLEALGWEALVLWECELGDSEKTARRLRKFLGPAGPVRRRDRKARPRVRQDCPSSD